MILITGANGQLGYDFQRLFKKENIDFIATDVNDLDITDINKIREFVKDKNIVTNIELKTGINEYFGIEEKVWGLIKEYNLAEKIIISSFNHYSVLKMKKIAPEIKCGFLSETWIINGGKYTKSYGVECYHPHFAMITDETAKEMKENGIEINTWTVNDENTMKDLISKGADILIGNYPDLTKKVIEEIYKK